MIQKKYVFVSLFLLLLLLLGYLVMLVATQSVKDEVQLISIDFIKHAFSDTADDIVLDEDFVSDDVMQLYQLKRKVRVSTPYANGARKNFKLLDFKAEHMKGDAYWVDAYTHETFIKADGKTIDSKVHYRLLVDTVGYRYQVEKAIADDATSLLLQKDFAPVAEYDFAHYQQDVRALQEKNRELFLTKS